jgi:hypothetical protein
VEHKRLDHQYVGKGEHERALEEYARTTATMISSTVRGKEDEELRQGARAAQEELGDEGEGGGRESEHPR